jgi:hypothetical protein
MPVAAIGLIVQGIEAAVSAAPTVMAVAQKAKDFISALATAGLISKAQQDAIHAHVDVVQQMAQAGIIPSHWQVQADPK